jgi:hypothetical protein
MEWQPIETAPRGGRAVDLWHTKEGRITDAQWRGDRWEVWEVDYDGAEGYGAVLDHHYITHWMAIPDPPDEP